MGLGAVADVGGAVAATGMSVRIGDNDLRAAAEAKLDLLPLRWLEAGAISTAGFVAAAARGGSELELEGVGTDAGLGGDSLSPLASGCRHEVVLSTWLT